MNNFRRRLSGGGAEYVFESNKTSINTTQSSPSGQIYVTSTVNGEYCNFEVLSYDGCVLQTNLYNWNSTGKRVWIQADNSSIEQGIGHVILKQEGSNKTIIITVNAEGLQIMMAYECVLLDGNRNSYGRNQIFPHYASYFIYQYGATTITKPDWVKKISYSKVESDTCDRIQVDIYTSSANNSSYYRIGDVTVRIGKSREFTFKVIQLQNDYKYKSYVTIANTNWGIKNVGASSVESIGNYYQWGAGSTTFQYGVNQYYTGGEYSLPASADTATQVLGSGWRMPTVAEFYSLFNQTHYWTYYNGSAGMAFTDNTNVVFFPPGGERRNDIYNKYSCRVWTSDFRGPSGPSANMFLAYNSGAVYCMMSYTNCNYGVQVRGVYN